MKLSKSKLALAKIINENGGWPERALWAVQDNYIAFFLGGKPEYKSGDRFWYSNSIDGACVGTITCDGKVTNWHQTILSREEYYQAYPKADADGWIEWKGGECPVSSLVRVDTKHRCGRVDTNRRADSAWWNHAGVVGDIVAYRLRNHANMHDTGAGDPNPVAEPEFCESVMRSIPEPESKPTIEQLAADYRNAKDCAERKQQEADDAKVDADSKLKALELAGEAIGLTVSPITERQAPELVITDWRQWLVGDVVSWSLLNHAVEFEIISVHHDQSRNIGDFEVKDKQGGVYRVYGNECRFIRRQ